MGVIDPFVDKVWLVVNRAAVSAVSIMPVITSTITAPEPSFLNAIYIDPTSNSRKS